MAEFAPLKRVSRVLAAGEPALLQRERYSLMAKSILQRQSAAQKTFAEKRYSLREAALALELCPATLRAWARRGFIKIIRSGPRGWGYVPQSEITRLQTGVPYE